MGPTRGLKGVFLVADDREREEDRAWKQIHAGLAPSLHTHPPPQYATFEKTVSRIDEEISLLLGCGFLCGKFETLELYKILQ